jgi:hypothetical protein
MSDAAKAGGWNKALWVAQVVLGLLFVFTGASKLVTSSAGLELFQLPVPFMRGIGVCELAGGLGLVLPGALKVGPWLTPLAAAGLFVVMIGAAWVSVGVFGPTRAVMPVVVGLLCVFVAYGRARLVPLRAVKREP